MKLPTRRTVMVDRSPIVVQIVNDKIIRWDWNYSLPVSRQKYEITAIYENTLDNSVLVNSYPLVKYTLYKREREYLERGRVE